MKEIPLTRGFVAIVDDDKYEELSAYKWHYVDSGSSYAARRLVVDGHKTVIYMHRQLMQVDDRAVKIDHGNGDGLDNRMSNLRVASHTQNMQNRKIRKDSTTGAKGVFLNKRSRKFYAEIRSAGKKHFLGTFETIKQAKEAYDAASVLLHGKFAREK